MKIVNGCLLIEADNEVRYLPVVAPPGEGKERVTS